MRQLKYMAILLLTFACGTGDNSAEDITKKTSEGTTTRTEGTATTAYSADVPLPEGFSSATLEEIAADAAHRTGAPISQIEVISIEATTFNDAALGCPEPGKMYAQVLTPGFIVLIDTDGSELDYRVAGGSDDFRICE